MTESESIECARAYVALSNAHRCDLIEPMFAGDAIYRSSAVGEYRGVAPIIEMMRGFFERYPDVYWQVEEYRYREARVAFDFVMSAHEKATGASLRRRGHEIIEFDAGQLIRQIVVEARASEI